MKAQFLRAKENSTHKIFTHNPDIEHSSKAHRSIDQKNDKRRRSITYKSFYVKMEKLLYITVVLY